MLRPQGRAVKKRRREGRARVIDPNASLEMSV
jgi:hypothetical protein